MPKASHDVEKEANQVGLDRKQRTYYIRELPVGLCCEGASTLASPPPKFWDDAVAEFLNFIRHVPLHAIGLLAELSEIQNHSKKSGIPKADRDATNVRNLYCRKLRGWILFYTATTSEQDFHITVLHVALTPRGSFDRLEAEAADRLRHLSKSP